MGSGSGNLALVARSELSQVTVVVTLPVIMYQLSILLQLEVSKAHAHLVVEDLGLASLGLGNEGFIEDVQDILADTLKLGLNLLAVVTDNANVLLRALRLLLLLDGGDDAPGGTASSNNILVGNAEEVALVDGKLATNLIRVLMNITGGCDREEGGYVIRWRLPVGDG